MKRRGAQIWEEPEKKFELQWKNSRAQESYDATNVQGNACVGSSRSQTTQCDPLLVHFCSKEFLELPASTCQFTHLSMRNMTMSMDPTLNRIPPLVTRTVTDVLRGSASRNNASPAAAPPSIHELVAAVALTLQVPAVTCHRGAHRPGRGEPSSFGVQAFSKALCGRCLCGDAEIACTCSEVVWMWKVKIRF